MAKTRSTKRVKKRKGGSARPSSVKTSRKAPPTSRAAPVRDKRTKAVKGKPPAKAKRALKKGVPTTVPKGGFLTSGYQTPVDPKRSAAAKKGWRTRRRKAALSLPSKAKRFIAQRERELRDIERRPYVQKITNNLKQINQVKNLFFRRMNRMGIKPDEIWRIYYGR